MEIIPEMTTVVNPLARGTVGEDPGRVEDAGSGRSDPEVPQRAKRRTFRAQYKLDIVTEYDAAPDGQKGLVLRREGLYSSHIIEWRKARDAGALAGLKTPRGRKRRDLQAEEIARLKADKKQLEQELAKARFVVDVQAKLHALLETLSESADTDPKVDTMTDTAISELAPQVGVRAACQALGAAQAGWYRRHRQSPPPTRPAPVAHRDRRQPRALTATEQQAILTELHSDRFVDLSPVEVWAILLDEGCYLGSISTFYRLLRQASGTRERRKQATHPATVKPELVADRPNVVWSWDITKLRGPAKWSWFYLYVIIDIYSRYVVGWMVATRESAQLAEVLIRQTLTKQGIQSDQLTIHADRGSSMTSKPVAFLLADLGVTQSHSRPHVSDDNPYSEAQFKTLKYRPDFPARFDSIEAARLHCQRFFGWYNHEHRHSDLGLHTPGDVHHGLAEIIREKRAGILNTAYAAHPERFVRKPPTPPELPSSAWINQPEEDTH